MSVTCVKCDGSVSPETVWCSDCIAALEAERDAAALIIKKHKNSRDRWKADIVSAATTIERVIAKALAAIATTPQPPAPDTETEA